MNLGRMLLDLGAVGYSARFELVGEVRRSVGEGLWPVGTVRVVVMNADGVPVGVGYGGTPRRALERVRSRMSPVGYSEPTG